MKFLVDQRVFEQFPHYIVPVIVATIDQTQYVHTDIVPSVDLSHPNYTAWIDAFKKAGIPQGAKPSHVALAERVAKGEKLPRIFPIVDYLNQVSLRFRIPIGAHDLGRLTHDIVVRQTTADDMFTPRGGGATENVEPGVFAYTHGNQVLTKNWIWRQGETSAVSENSTHIFIPIDQLSTETVEHVTEITHRIAQELEEKFGATTQIFFVTKTNQSCEWKDATLFSKEDLAVRELLTRGVAQILPAKDSLATRMTKGKIRLYLGIDPTGAQLHLGHSVVLRKLNQFAQAGHEVILLIGNGTVRIGDPTGRDSSRPVLTDEQIQENFQTWKAQASKVLDFSKIRIVYNGDWLDALSYADIVKLMAQTTVQQLIERDMFQERMKKGLPIFGHEIMYPLLQGYDSVALDVDLELGGTDQTFNMMMGRHLQEVYNHKEKWVLTTPIINGTDGRKMSKSYNNFVSLTETANDMYGKLMSIHDDLIIPYFTLLTDVPSAEIARMEAAIAAGDNPMQYKKELARTITTQYHSPEAAQAAQEHFENTVQGDQIPENLPTISVPQGASLLALVTTAQPTMSNSEARRLITQGGVELDGTKPVSPADVPTITTGMILRVGKRKYFALEVRSL